MKRRYYLLTILSVFSLPLLSQVGFTINHLSTYETGIFDDGAAEITAYDSISQRIFFTNSANTSIIILNIMDPSMPSLIKEVDLTEYGSGINSVDFSNGILAAAIEANTGTDPGKVLLLDAEGTVLNEVTVGALPDMLVFTHSGQKILVANEGEPNDDYSVDPEGSISIVDLSNGVENPTVTTLSFTAYNNQKASLINKGIRIFGPNATVSQDLEPEYITISDDDALAYVGLQENNALAVIDLSNNTILDLFPLGTKNHGSGTPTLAQYNLNELVENWPELGTPVYDGGQPPVLLGGFSGLYFDEDQSTDQNYVFYAVPDRGPNDAAVNKDSLDQADVPANIRPFKLPDYQGRFVKFTLDRANGTVTLDTTILLSRERTIGLDSTIVVPITGKGNVIGFDEIPVTYTDTNTIYRNPDYTIGDEAYHEVNYDPYGGDFEGIVKDSSGNFWMCDEYRPSLYKFNSEGLLIERYVPDGTSDLGLIQLEIGFYGAETLPKVYRKRRANRGFEAIAYQPDSNIIYGFIQSPVEAPDNSVRNQSDIIRILGVDASSGVPVSEYVYLLERNRESGFSLARTDKIGDAVYVGNNKFLVIERDSSTPDDGDNGHKYIFEVDLTGATNILSLPIASKSRSDGPEDPTLEMLTADQLDSLGIQPVFKEKVLNLPSIGYFPSDKPEGIALLPGGDLAVLNDNDFGLAGAGISDLSTLGIISFGSNNGLDASNEDGQINITNHPVRGLYQPDALTSFKHEGNLFIATANEGDAREYEDDAGNGFVEEDRIKDATLDPTAFPEAATLQEEANLGRLKYTTTQGDLDQDGDMDVLYSFGARSFSIWDQFGNLVYDSGDDFEQITATRLPDDFNSNNDENGSFDNRSDDKGPEPEAIEVFDLNGVRIALIGLERIGGIMAYNINNPTTPVFLDYINNRDFSAAAESSAAKDLGIEQIKFISAAESPSGVPLVITANEVSGTVSIFELSVVSNVDPVYINQTKWRVYPNPVVERLFTNVVSDYTIFNTLGQPLLQVQQTQEIDVSNLPKGTYFIHERTSGKAQPFIIH